MKNKIAKLINVYKKDGFKVFCKKCIAYIRANYLDKLSLRVLLGNRKYSNMLDNILLNNNYERIVIWRSSFGYNVPLFQRPQHITSNMAKQGCLVFYEVTRVTDNVKTITKLKDNIYLVNFNNSLLNKMLRKKLKDITKPKYLQIYSTDWKLKVEDIKDYEKDGFKVIYEYIDDLSAEIAGTKTLPLEIVQKYNYAMENSDIYIVVTAKILEEDVINKRGHKRLIFASNGVDYAFFQKYDEYELDNDFKNILALNKPILCYYGAIAKWFDYDLIKKIAHTNKYSIVLFGVKYDEAFDKNIEGEDNIYFLGTKDYQVLKYYAQKCDIMMIPFIINSITKATSPVKIFEYMAMHKPIVITDLNECHSYKSVMIAKSHEDFLNLLDKAYNMKDNKDYIELLDKEASSNDWYFKAQEIINKLKVDENN